MKKILINILIFTVLFGGIFAMSGNIVSADNAASIGDSVVCWGGVTSGFSLSGCVASFSYNIVYKISSWVIFGASTFFNYLLSFSLDSQIINASFINDAWSALRGMANMLFIFILVILSIGIILNFKGYNNKSLIRDIILIALLVNFSLFAARVVIDTGNIFALGFYDAIKSKDITETDPIGTKELSVPTKDISGSMMSAFNPAQLINVDSFSSWQKDKGGGNWMLIIIFLIASAINIYAAYIFFMAGFLFVARIAWLWILMAVAPLAFISFVIPGLKNLWTKWWKELFNKSFCIVVFLFLIWLTLMIIGSNFFDELFNTENIINVDRLIIMVFLQFIIVIKLFGISLSETKKMCDDGGLSKKAFGMVKGITGLVTGVATGGMSVAARQIIGTTASRATKAMESRGFGKGRTSKMILQSTRALEKAKFGTKEGFKERAENIAKKEQSYIKTLPKEIKKGKYVGQNAQEMYMEEIGKTDKIKGRNIISFMTGKRAGEIKAVEDIKKKESLKKEIQEIRDKEVTPKKLEIMATKKEISDFEKAGNVGAASATRRKLVKQEEEMRNINERIKNKEDDSKK